LLSITLETEEKAEAFINTCPMLRPATSFGGVHSSAERRARWGDDVDPAFIRLSVGCEPIEELWQSFESSLNAL
jgi:cystathionine gamma-lyase